MKKVIVASDSFKGTLSSVRVYEIIKEVLTERYEGIEVMGIPIADGGEGTVDAFLCALGGEKVYTTVKSPLMRDIESFYGLLPDGTAVIELAAASGITIEKEPDAVNSSTFGTGQLILHAIENGAKKVILGIGGSATTDGGMGCAAALGAKFLDKSGTPVPLSGKGLSMVERVDLSGIYEAVKKAGYVCGKDVYFALDVAASEWKPEENASASCECSRTGARQYHLPKSGANYSSDELIDMYNNLVIKYPIISIEDPLDEGDWEGWKKITDELGDKVQLVGDDLFVTNTTRLYRGIESGCANSILIKPNQIGSVSETIEAIKLAKKAGYTTIASHRSGETEDTTIADLAVALNCGQIKTGAPCRSERVAKYNELLRIEEELGTAAMYPGIEAFTSRK